MCECKKPRGRLAGDIFPDQVKKYAKELADPLTRIFQNCLNEAVWPKVWKLETITTIPKCSNPVDLSETRNISCTPVYSKVLEYFVLNQLRKKVGPSPNQFCGIPGSWTNHYLAESWTEIMRCLESEGAVCGVTSIDFSKAFNSVSHQSCIEALYKHGASAHSLKMVHSFLKNRVVRFKVNNVISSPRALKGGSPQGTFLGNFLFLMATEDLEQKPLRTVEPAPSSPDVGPRPYGRKW